MRLTRYTDYAMRTLMHLAQQPARLSSISEIADAHRISRNHLMKVVNDLANAGYVASTRGRNGGIRLARPAEEMNVGAIIRHTEADLALLDCATCRLAPACGLACALDKALKAFLSVLDGYTLADLGSRRGDLGRLLGLPPAPASPAPASKVPA
ncbi:Rrf2 family transcriptional regulator [Sandaracinobacter sp. RS1-74]|uniref:Rrf2 family transcriptional regulator n=1 Tax=Sandaracinobacteroides sayramensis TaxID=2913411 RepID=UPI001EDADA40|nr:Rrf2 family transcriptional regulator [Sandaracinobacteroides sayramensis]MCG2839851.1 Rrf2 family transcriptional regulator [Sandaracinobacteroides sayramensis]